MYPSHQLLRVHHDEWLRYAETRRLVKQADGSPRKPRRLRVRRPALAFGRPLRHA